LQALEDGALLILVPPRKAHHSGAAPALYAADPPIAPPTDADPPRPSTAPPLENSRQGSLMASMIGHQTRGARRRSPLKISLVDMRQSAAPIGSTRRPPRRL